MGKTKTKKLRGFGFYRTSGETGSQNRGYGLATQKKDVREYCKKNGIELVGEYVSDGISGTEFEKGGRSPMKSGRGGGQ